MDRNMTNLLGDNVLTWKELAKMIEEMPEERKNDNATIALPGYEEVYGIEGLAILSEQYPNMSDILDDGHYVICPA